MVEAGRMGGGHQDGDLKKSAWVLCPSGVQGGQRARIERLPRGEPSGHDGGISAGAREKSQWGSIALCSKKAATGERTMRKISKMPSKLYCHWRQMRHNKHMALSGT